MTYSDNQATALRNLEDCLGTELDAVASGLQLLRDKQRALVDCVLASLVDYAKREIDLASQLACLEAQRIAAVADVARGFSVNAEEATLGSLVSLLKLDSTVSRVPELVDALSDQLNLLVDLNYQNELLTRNMLEYTQMVVTTITREHGTPRYGNNGRVSDGAQSRPILNDVV